MPERWRLANRLQSRLGLLGVFYKRDPTRFLRNLPAAEATELVASLERTYRDLLLSYFRDPASANQALESFVNTAFFSDLPITKTVEIHVNLIDAFSKQLKLQGHKSDFLQDYRLALLDVMAHLCEMYRRSIPPDEPLQQGRSSL
jgi:circadian clock protein KaiA